MLLLLCVCVVLGSLSLPSTVTKVRIRIDVSGGDEYAPPPDDAVIIDVEQRVRFSHAPQHVHLFAAISDSVGLQSFGSSPQIMPVITLQQLLSNVPTALEIVELFVGTSMQDASFLTAKQQIARCKCVRLSRVASAALVSFLTSMQFQASADKKVFTKLLSRNGSDLSLRDVFLINNRTRASVVNWMLNDDWGASFFGYGAPHYLRPLINLYTGDAPTGHDLISWLAAQLRAPVRLLEIGVSVGKSLYTQTMFLPSSAEVWAYELEDINPALRGLLRLDRKISEWTAEHLEQNAVTVRRRHGKERADTIVRYIAPSGTPLYYMAADLFNGDAWQHLKDAMDGKQFNVVYSDAAHAGYAVLHEVQKLFSMALLDATQLLFVWDDCDDNNGILKAILGSVPRFQKLLSRICYGALKVPGWVGIHEPLHNHCIITTLPIDQLIRTDKSFAQLTWLAPLRCIGK